MVIKDKTFKPFISSQEIQAGVQIVANKINKELKDDLPLFLVVLNGSFMFAADLLKKITIPCEISFVKVASYYGTTSSGAVTELIGLSEDVYDRTVVIVEDIVDTGNTLEKLETLLTHKGAKKIRIATCFFKREAYIKTIPIDYYGIEVPHLFIVGYGLDYEGLGRNTEDLYVLIDPETT